MNTYLPEGIAGRASSFPSCSAPALLPACTGVCAFHSLLRGHCNSSFTRDTLVPILGGPQSCHLVMGGKARDSQCAPLRSLFHWGHTAVPGLLGSQGLFLKLLGDPWEDSCLCGGCWSPLWEQRSDPRQTPHSGLAPCLLIWGAQHHCPITKLFKSICIPCLVI